jgi:hypothetical protein
MKKLIDKEYKEPVVINIDQGDFESIYEWRRLMAMLDIDKDPATIGTINLTVTRVAEWDWSE